jgi:hypothetical protein
MAEASRDDTLNLLDDFIAAMEEDLDPDFAAGEVTLVSLKADRGTYSGLLGQGRAAERKAKAVSGQINDFKTTVLGRMQAIREEVGVVKGKRSAIYRRFPKAQVSGSPSKKTETTTTGTS